MREEQHSLKKPCPHCGNYGVTIGYSDGTNIPQYIICNGCGEDLV